MTAQRETKIIQLQKISTSRNEFKNKKSSLVILEEKHDVKTNQQKQAKQFHWPIIYLRYNILAMCLHSTISLIISEQWKMKDQVVSRLTITGNQGCKIQKKTKSQILVTLQSYNIK